MTPFVFKTTAFVVLLAYILISAIWRRPRTNAGKVSWKLCLVNVFCWVIVLPLGTSGHPPPLLIIGYILWLLNLPILIATPVALWVSFKSHNEDIGYLACTAVFVALNIIVLWIIPVIGLISVA